MHVSQSLLQRNAAYFIKKLKIVLLFPLGKQSRRLNIVNLLSSFVPGFCSSCQRSVIHQPNTTQRSQAVLAGEASPAKLAFATGIPVQMLGRSGSERLVPYFTVYHKICKAVLKDGVSTHIFWWMARMYLGCTSKLLSPAVSLKLGLNRMAIRPMRVPAYLPLGITAFTKSPVWNPIKNFKGGAWRIGKPCLLVPQRCRLPCPLAVISNGLMLRISNFSGVLLPTFAASPQWLLSIPLVTRLNLVRPPVPVSTGNLICCNLLYNSHRVVLTAAASFKGALAWDKSFLTRSGWALKKSCRGWLPFLWLQSWQARVKLLTLSDPPLDLGCICSTSSGVSPAPQ